MEVERKELLSIKRSIQAIIKGTKRVTSGNYMHKNANTIMGLNGVLDQVKSMIKSENKYTVLLPRDANDYYDFGFRIKVLSHFEKVENSLENMMYAYKPEKLTNEQWKIWFVKNVRLNTVFKVDGDYPHLLTTFNEDELISKYKQLLEDLDEPSKKVIIF